MDTSRFFLIVLLCSVSAYAGANDARCSAPPYGDTAENYAAYQSSDLKEVGFVLAACDVKFQHGARQKFYAAGIIDQEIETQSTTELAERLLNFTFDTLFREHGKRITVADFALDGKQLAANAMPVIIHGAYVLQGATDTLYADTQAVIMADVGTHPTVGLLTEDAARVFRQHLLSCQENPSTAQLGCLITIRGFATLCTRTNAFGTVRELPCVRVLDGQ